MSSIDGENEIAPRRCSPTPGQGGEVRQPVDGHVHLAGRAAELEPADLGLELGVQRARFDELEERPVGIERAQDRVGADLLAVLEDDPDRTAVLRQDPLDRGFEPDLGPERAGRVADRVADPAGPALRDAPGPERAVDLAHVVVEQDVGRARALDALVRADDPGRGHRGLERIRLEPLVEELGRAHRHELDEDRLLALRAAPGTPGRGRPAAGAAADPGSWDRAG